MSNEDLYVPSPSERVEVIEIASFDESPEHAVGEIVEAGYVVIGDRYILMGQNPGTYCRVRPAAEAEAIEDWARSRSMCTAPIVPPSDEHETTLTRINEVGLEVTAELVNAMTKFPPFNTAHEGYAVLLEEVDELWDEIKKKQGTRDAARLRKEAVQIAAMAIRFAIECDGIR